MHRWTALVLTFVVGVAMTTPAAAQWKWRDAQGRTQYSDTPPPPSVPDKDILQRPTVSAPMRAAAPAASAPASGASGASGLTPKIADSELEAKRKKTEEDAADKATEQKKADEAKIAAARADNCARAKAQMRTFDSGVRVSRTNDKGEREFLDDKARAQEVQRTRDAMASDCK